MARNLGVKTRGNDVKRHWQPEDIDRMELLEEQKHALKANLAVMHCLDQQIDGLDIALETGDLGRFAGPGNFASYARTVESRRESNGKKKGEGNAKCGNKHWAWAFVEAAHIAVRYDAAIRR